MKKIGSFNLGLAFAGCFLGAGYVSGQELWQFFGSFGAKGVAGLLVAVALLFFTGIIMILLGRLTRLSEIDKIVVRRDWPLLRGAVTVLELLFLFGVGTIMSAGVGALLEQLFGLAPFIGSAVFAALVAVVSLAGFSGIKISSPRCALCACSSAACLALATSSALCIPYSAIAAACSSSLWQYTILRLKNKMHKRRDRSITPFFYLYRAVRTMLISAVIIFAKTVLHQIIIWPPSRGGRASIRTSMSTGSAKVRI